jgi:RNA polymerase sigma factor (sigma-70 family)
VDREPAADEALTRVFRAEWPRLVAAATRIVGDLQAAEDVAQEVLIAALHRWPLAGVPDNPGAWLMTACRRRALNARRDSGRARSRDHGLVPLLGPGEPDPPGRPVIEDDRLRLVFICCHPVLPLDARVALTLRMVGGLSTAEIAAAYHTPTATIAQRIVRAKRTLAERRVPFVEPAGHELALRLPAVVEVVYLIFNEGYLASTGQALTRPPLAEEAHRLARLLTELLPDSAEVWALRALIALQRSRDDARLGDDGELLTLREQDRGRWNRDLIAEGLDALARADRCPGPGGPLMREQARLAAYHAAAPSFDATDWVGVIGCYDRLLDGEANPVVALNRAVAVAMAHGAARALPLVDGLVREPALARTHRAFAVRADLLGRLGRAEEAAADYDRALDLVDNDVERRHLRRMRAALRTTEGSTRPWATPNTP